MERSVKNKSGINSQLAFLWSVAVYGKMSEDFSIQAAFMGLLAAFVGFASSFAVVLQGLVAVGATPAQSASGLMALSIAMGLCGIVLSLGPRLPVSVAWSTPGSALLVTTGTVEGGFAGAVGAFLVCGVLIVIAGLWKPLASAVSRIPGPLANAMLAGILVGLCFAPFKAIGEYPLLGGIILAVWILVGAWRRLWAVPAALIAFVFVVAFGVDLPVGTFETLGDALIPRVEIVTPTFVPATMIGLGLPLFVVTMASQNIPGIAVLSGNGYPLTPGYWFRVTGIGSILAAPFGGHAVNLAAITAALCAGEDAHADRDRRYWAAVIAGGFYVLFGLLAGVVIAFVTLAPAILIQAVAGLALIPAFTGASVAAFEKTETREAAAVTFLFSASGVSVLGVSGAFWGLLAGGAVMALRR